jgi:hypothetical protein
MLLDALIGAGDHLLAAIRLIRRPPRPGFRHPLPRALPIWRGERDAQAGDAGTDAPRIASAFLRRDAAELAEALGRELTARELCMAEFLGTAAAKRLLLVQAGRSRARAAAVAANAANTNRASSDGRSGPGRPNANGYEVAATARTSSAIAAALRCAAALQSSSAASAAPRPYPARRRAGGMGA